MSGNSSIGLRLDALGQPGRSCPNAGSAVRRTTPPGCPNNSGAKRPKAPALRLWSEVPSAIFANVVAAILLYWLTRKRVWGRDGRPHILKERLPFRIMVAASIALAAVGANGARDLGHHWRLDHFDQTVLLLVANVISLAMFWLLRLAALVAFKAPSHGSLGALGGDAKTTPCASSIAGYTGDPPPGIGIRGILLGCSPDKEVRSGVGTKLRVPHPRER